MKRIFTAIGAVILCIQLAGCAPQDSLYPLFSDSDALAPPGLLGEWQIQSGGEFKAGTESGMAIFANGVEKNSYLLTLPDFDKEAVTLVCSVRFGKLSGILFADMSTPDLQRAKANLFPYPFVLGHVFGRVHLEKDMMRIDFLSDDWVKNQQKAGKLSLPHVVGPEGILLTAPSEELGKFAIEHSEDKEAFSEQFIFKRKK